MNILKIRPSQLLIFFFFFFITPTIELLKEEKKKAKLQIALSNVI